MENYLAATSISERNDYGIEKGLEGPSYKTLENNVKKVLNWKKSKWNKFTLDEYTNKKYNTLGAYIIGEANREYWDKFDSQTREYIDWLILFNRLPKSIAILILRLAKKTSFLKSSLKLAENIASSDFLNRGFMPNIWDETFEDLKADILKYEIEKENILFENNRKIKDRLWI